MKTLIVSENNAEAEILRRILRFNFRDLYCLQASTKNEIENAILTDGPFGFYIVDADMRQEEPEMLCQSIRDLSGDKPFLFIGKSASIIDRISQELYQSNSFNDQIYKPFERKDITDEIKNKVSGILDWARQEEFESSIEEIDKKDFIEMKLKNFYLSSTFPYDIYLEITSTEHIKIISANKPYSSSTLDRYAKKNVKSLYIKKDDHLEYLEKETIRCTKHLKKIFPSNDEYPIALLRAVTILHQYMITLGTSDAIFSLVDEVAEGILKYEGHYKSIRKMLTNFPEYYAGIASKSLITGFIAIHLAKKNGWESNTTKMKLAVCSILQDYSLPDEAMAHINYPIDARLNQYSEEDLEKFFNHPIDAANISKQFSKYTDTDYILEHHQELYAKKGFPNQVTSSKFTVICCLFNAAQFFAAEIDGHKYKKDIVSKVMKSMARDFSKGNFKIIFDILRDNLN